MPDNDLDAYLDPTPKPRRGNYDEIITRHAQRTGLDLEFVRAVVHQESGGNRRAVSRKGAQGLGQLMPATAKRFGVTDPFDPEQNIRGATDYLKFLNDRFKGNRDLVLAGYNAGEGAVDKFKGIPPYRETQNYVKSINARLGQRQPRPTTDLDSYLDPVTDEFPPPTRQNQRISPMETAIPSATNPPSRQRSPSRDFWGRVRQRMEGQVQPAPVRSAPTVQIPDWMRRQNQNRTIELQQRQQQEAATTEAKRELDSRRIRLTGPFGPMTIPSGTGLLAAASNPLGAVSDLFKSDEEQVQELTTENLRRQRVAQEPEVESIRKEYGQMSGPQRIVTSSLAKGGAGLLDFVSGLAELGGALPKGVIPPADKLSDWAKKRSEIIETGAMMAPLREERGLSSLITEETQLKELDRGFFEKVATAAADVGVGVGQIILLKKATGLKFNQVLALEAAARNSEKPLSEQLARTGEAYALGTALDRGMSRKVSAAVSGIPAAMQTGYEVAQGRMSPLDAAIQTGVQAATGAVLTRPPSRKVREVERYLDEPQTQTLNRATDTSREIASAEVSIPTETRPRNLSVESQPDIRGVPVEAQRVPTVAERPLPKREPEIANEPQVQTKSPVEGNVSGARIREPDTGEAAKGIRERSIEQETPKESLTRFFHRDSNAEVTVSRNQGRISDPDKRVRVVLPNGREKVVARNTLVDPDAHYSNFQKRTEAGEFDGPPAYKPDVGEAGDIKSSPSPASLESTTSARKTQMAQDRVELDLPELPPAQRKSWQRSLNEAKPEQANRLADEVLNKPRALNDSETASLVVRAQQVKNEHRAKLREVEQAEPDNLPRLQSELETLEREFDLLTRVAKASGTEKGRSLAAQKLTINQDFDLVSLVAQFKAAAGREPKPSERAQIEHLVKENTRLEAALAKAESERVQGRIQEQIDRVRRTQRRTQTKTQIDDEWASLKSQFAEIRQREAGFFKSEEGAFDPEAVKLIGKMVRNRVQAGVVSAEQLVDDIHAITGGDKRELRDAISGYRTKPSQRQSELQQQVNALKSELRQLSTTEDIAAGSRTAQQQGPVREFKRDQTRRRQIERQIADLEQQMESGEFKDSEHKEPPRYTRETYALQKELERVRNRYEEMKHKAKLGPWGHALHTLSSLRKSWMLSGLSTQAKNIGGTGGYQVFDEVSRLPSVIVDAAIAPITGRRSISGPSPVAMLDSALHAATKGGREAAEILRTGATKEQLERHQFSEIDTGVKLVDLTGNLVFRFMSASDRVFYEYAYKRNLTDRATTQARNEGGGKERVRELIDNPPEELDAAAKHDALVNTFNNNNKLSDAIRNARARLGPEANFALDMIMPFDRTPTNVISRIVEASPVGAGSAVYKLVKSAVNKSLTQEEQRQFSQTMGRATAGTALMGLGWALADDLLEVDEYKVMLNVGGYRVDLAAISPVGNLIALGARLREDYEKGDKLGAVETLGSVPLQQPLLRGVEDVGKVVKEPKEAVIKSSARLASSFIPFGGMARDIAKLTDSELGRYARSDSFRQQVAQGIPGLRQQLPITERPRTRAERWARGFARDRMKGVDLDSPPETDKYVTLRTRARRGEDVSAELNQLKGKITDRQVKAILAARSKTRLQEDVNRLGIKDALNVYSVANSQQRAELKELLEKKAGLVNTLLPDEQRQVRERLQQLGITVPAMRISRPSRESRQSRAAR